MGMVASKQFMAIHVNVQLLFSFPAHVV
jgi:hypothetical protein